jgi:hypothetical protein
MLRATLRRFVGAASVAAALGACSSDDPAAQRPDAAPLPDVGDFFCPPEAVLSTSLSAAVPYPFCSSPSDSAALGRVCRYPDGMSCRCTGGPLTNTLAWWCEGPAADGGPARD